MKRSLLSALAFVCMGTMMSSEAYAQFSVIKDGKVILHMAEGTPDYVVFDDVLPCGGIIGEAVDMGLSVKWASVNIGASSPEMPGNYYAWGETEAKDVYEWDTYAVEHNVQFLGDGKKTLEKSDDAASVNWEGDWMTPTDDDWEELFYNTTQTWTDNYNGTGAKGYILTSTIEGYTEASIFLPSAGYCEGCNVYEDSKGYYCSSSLVESASDYCHYAECNSYYFNVYNHLLRYIGRSVRPICPASGVTNGHDAIDLGLTSGNLWATCNVGANAPGKPGSYFAWGETTSKEEYLWSTYKHLQSGKSDWQYINKYQMDDHKYEAIWYKNAKFSNNGGETVLDASNDVATQSWGDGWRMPTYDEWDELKENTTQTWTDNYNGTGVKGYILTSTIEGYTEASIFLPAAGYSEISNSMIENTYGVYWSSSLCDFDSGFASFIDFTQNAYCFYHVFNPRFVGMSVRPVHSKD